MQNFDEVLLELSYRVGIIDLTKEHQVTELINILKENGYDNAFELGQKTRVYFSYLNEADASQFKGYFHRGGGYYSKQPDGEITHKSDKGKLKALSAKEKEDKNKNKPTSADKTQTKSTQNIFSTDTDKDKTKKSKSPDEIKVNIDKISIESGESRKLFYKKGYHKSEGDDDAGAAPGNAGSMLNENGSCDVCEWSLENDSDNAYDIKLQQAA
jgi:hypothetical protein